MRTILSRSAAESYLWFPTSERLEPFAIREPSMEGEGPQNLYYRAVRSFIPSTKTLSLVFDVEQGSKVEVVKS